MIRLERLPQARRQGHNHVLLPFLAAVTRVRVLRGGGHGQVEQSSDAVQDRAGLLPEKGHHRGDREWISSRVERLAEDFEHDADVTIKRRVDTEHFRERGEGGFA